MFSDLHVNVKIRLIVDFFQRIINHMVIPFMALYFSLYYGAGIAGILTLIIILWGMIAGFYGGYLSDIKGRRPLLLTAELSNIIIFGLLALINSPWITSPVGTFILLLLLNTSINIGKPAADATIIDVSPPKVRKFIYTIKYWLVNLAFAIGAAVGAFLFKDFFFIVLLISSFCSICFYLVYYLFVEETMPEKPKQKTSQKKFVVFKSYKAILSDEIFLKFLLVSLIIMSLEYQLIYYISVRLANHFESQSLFKGFFNLDINGVEMFGILQAQNTLLVVCFSGLMIKLLRGTSDKTQLYSGTILFTIGYILLGYSTSFWLLLISMLVVTVGEMSYFPVKQSLLSVLIDDNNRTKYMAVYGLHSRGGMVIASLTLSISAFLPNWIILSFFGFSGVISLYLYYSILNDNRTQGKLEQLEG
ncbi:MFS transporter [Virgibacillus sp. DJP39]|uniref:MFS transporter n=1 Tax=Virgibacillus sp. DJP39 TaxID=3409790 RepID=UPI003BB720B3